MAENDDDTPRKSMNIEAGWDTPQAVALLVLGALLFLVAIRRGLRGALAA